MKSTLEKQLSKIKIKKPVFEKKSSSFINPFDLGTDKKRLNNESKGIETSPFSFWDNKENIFDLENLRKQAEINVYGLP